MTFEEYKEVLEQLDHATAIYSTSDHFLKHPFFHALVEDEDGKKYLHELLCDYRSWIVLCLATRYYPDMTFNPDHVGRYDKIRDDYLTWLENNA